MPNVVNEPDCQYEDANHQQNIGTQHPIVMQEDSSRDEKDTRKDEEKPPFFS
jgi:hypothetical protein